MRTIEAIESDLKENRRARLATELQIIGVINRLWDTDIAVLAGFILENTKDGRHKALMSAGKIRHDLYPLVTNWRKRSEVTTALVAEWNLANDARRTDGQERGDGAE